MQHYLKLSRIKNVYTLRVSNYSVISDMIRLQTTDLDDLLEPRVRNVKDKLLYSDYIEGRKINLGYNKNIEIRKKLRHRFKKEKESLDRLTPNLSIALKYLNNDNKNVLQQSNNYNSDEEEIQKEKPIHMPYASIDKYEKVPIKSFEHKSVESMPAINEKYRILYEKYLEISKFTTVNPNVNNELKIRLGDDLSNIPQSWMTDYEIYDDALEEDGEDVKYGTPDPDTEVSSISCGGCGALLHCKDVAIPGYLPSELFLNKDDSDLKSITCQRCHFMKYYNTCLDVRVSADEYPKLLEQINENKKAVVILLVDLTDFPCSIWPGLPSLIGEHRHVYVVGNKIDLLPKDAPDFLEHVKDCLAESLIEAGLAKANIKHIGLISAKTGYGVEELINRLHRIWRYRSDVYLVGCTNAGKSTLFNTLLHSDFCKSQAVDLVQRATISPWPGTTLNMLKFPILRPSNWRLYCRTKRLLTERKHKHAETYLREQELKQTRRIELATLQSRISHTFKKHHELEQAARKSNNADIITIEKSKKFGLDETSGEYQYSRWCYDTPGTIQPDQILHFLTTDELIKTLPSKIISPRTFCIWSGQTIFIAGLGRLDILNVPSFIRCTVFASHKLPVTICEINNAELVYNELLQSEAFVVPINNSDRLKMWPEFKSKEFETVGIGKFESVSDVVLSSAGWIAITASEDETVRMRAWTPEGRGIYLRTPPLLPKSVTLRGMRRIGSPAYRLGRQVYYSKKV